MRAFLLLLILAPGLLTPHTAAAQRVRTPAHGTAERRAILDAARALVRERLQPAGPVEFNVRSLGVLNDWALLTVEPRAPIGALLPEFEATCQCDCEIVTLLQRRSGRWTVVGDHFDPCDAAVYDWPSTHGAPGALFAHSIGGVWEAYVRASEGDDPWLALRSEPSVSRGTRLARIPDGTRVEASFCQSDEVEVEGRRGHWCYVHYQGRGGWAFDAFLDRAE